MTAVKRESPVADERGATLALVALASVVIFGMAALVIDLGNGWVNRRALIPGTDAAALAAAQDYVGGASVGTACGTGDSYLAANSPGSSRTGCVWGGTSEHGWVTYSAEVTSETWFASIIGGGDFPVGSTSSARFAPPASVIGLRPIGFCIDASPDLRDLILNPPSSPRWMRIEYYKDDPDDCGGPSHLGNWGTIDFNGSTNSYSTLNDWIRNGYPDEVIFGDLSPADCTGDPHCYPGRLFPLRFVDDGTDDLEDDDIYVPWPIYDFIDTTGTPEFHIVAIIRARLLSSRVVTSNPADRYFEFLVDPGVVTGTCCGNGVGSAGNKVIAICGVDPSNGINDDHVLACKP